MGTENIHDAFARETLSYKDNAACFFRGILPKDMGKRLDFGNLQEEKTSYTDKDLSAYLSGDTDLFARFIPGFEYILYLEEALMNNLDSFFSPDIVYFTLEEGLQFIESFCRYVFKATKIDHAAILRKIPMLPDKAKEVIMTTAEKLRKQGKQEGKQEGLEEGEKRGKQEAKLEDARRMLTKGYPIEDICEITGLSRGEVEKLK